MKNSKKPISLANYINNEIELLNQNINNYKIAKADDVHNFAIIKNYNIEKIDRIVSKKVANYNDLVEAGKLKKNISDVKIKDLKNEAQIKKKKIELINTKKISDYKNRVTKSIKYRENVTKKSIFKLNSKSKKYGKKTDLLSKILFKSTSVIRFLGFLSLLNKLMGILNENKLMIIILLIAIVAGISSEVFFTKRNIFTNILKNNVTIGIMAVGMTFVILTGGIDLSVGSLLGFSGIYSMGFLLGGLPTLLAFIFGIIMALVVGLIQGILISYLNLQPFIVTLVGLLSIRGIVYLHANGSPKTDIGNKVFDFLQTTDFLGVPFLVWILIILVLSSMFILKYTSFGRHIYSVGGNVEASKLAGINTKRILMIVYGISGLTAGLASLAFASNISSIGPTSGNSYELDVIASVVLGGTSLSGGKGGVGKTFLGWLVISVLSNALIILNFDPNWQLVFKGLVILIAIILDKNFEIIKKFKKLVIKYI